MRGQPGPQGPHRARVISIPVETIGGRHMVHIDDYLAQPEVIRDLLLPVLKRIYVYRFGAVVMTLADPNYWMDEMFNDHGEEA